MRIGRRGRNSGELRGRRWREGEGRGEKEGKNRRKDGVNRQMKMIQITDFFTPCRPCLPSQGETDGDHDWGGGGQEGEGGGSWLRRKRRKRKTT